MTYAALCRRYDKLTDLLVTAALFGMPQADTLRRHRNAVAQLIWSYCLHATDQVPFDLRLTIPESI